MSVIKTNPGFVLLNADPIVWVNFNCSAKPKDYGHKASSSSAGVENLRTQIVTHLDFVYSFMDIPVSNT